MTRKLTIFSARGALAVAGLAGLALTAAGAALGAAVHPGFWLIPTVVAVNAALVGLAFVARRNAAPVDEDDVEEQPAYVVGCYRCQMGDPHTVHQTAAQVYGFDREMGVDEPTMALPVVDQPPVPHALSGRPAALTFGMAAYPRFSVPAAWSTDDLTVLLPAQRANTNHDNALDDV